MRRPADLYGDLPVTPDECGHVGHMVFREESCECTSCGQRWAMLYTADDERRALGWRPAGRAPDPIDEVA